MKQNMKAVDLTGKSTSEVVDAISECITTIAQMGMNAGGDRDGISGAVYVGATSALSCIIPMAPFCGRRPSDQTLEEVNRLSEDEQQALIRKHITPETVQFAALLSAYTLVEFDAKNGRQTMECNSAVLWNALKAWKILNPDKKAEDHLNAMIVKEARKAGQDADAPFDKFLQDRVKEFGHEAPPSAQ